MGSAVALATGLLMTWIVILFLPADQARFAPEHAPLLRAVAVFTLFSAASAGSLYGELRARSSRPAAAPPTGRRGGGCGGLGGCTAENAAPPPPRPEIPAAGRSGPAGASVVAG